MGQYEHTTNDKPRIKLPLIKDDADSRVKDIERKLLELEVENQRLKREVGRVKSDINDMRVVLRNMLR